MRPASSKIEVIKIFCSSMEEISYYFGTKLTFYWISVILFVYYTLLASEFVSKENLLKRAYNSLVIGLMCTIVVKSFKLTFTGALGAWLIVFLSVIPPCLLIKDFRHLKVGNYP
jgi:uncharacterized membrane protein